MVRIDVIVLRTFFSCLTQPLSPTKKDTLLSWPTKILMEAIVSRYDACNEFSHNLLCFSFPVKGLIINFIHNFWPSLLDIPGFLQQFITPIVKVTKNKRSTTFFTLHEYKKWLESTGNNGKGFTIKYYKGLGTSTSAEAKEYFSDLGRHLIDFGCINEDQISIEETEQVLPDSVTSGSDLIDMVFRKDRVEDRKTWLSNIQAGVYLDYNEASTEGVRYSDFFNKEFILFSQYDTHRSIPHLVDGLKVSHQRKQHTFVIYSLCSHPKGKFFSAASNESSRRTRLKWPSLWVTLQKNRPITTEKPHYSRQL